MGYIAKAEYISFRGIDGISFAIKRVQSLCATITSIETGIVRFFEDDKLAFSVEFSKPPTSIRFTVLESNMMDLWPVVFPFLQAGKSKEDWWNLAEGL